MFLVCGLYYPMATTAIGGLYTAARILFQVGYNLYGPKGRMAAVPIIMLTQFLFPIFTMVAMYKFGTMGGSTPAEAQSNFETHNKVEAA